MSENLPEQNELLPLSDIICQAIMDWCAASGGGFPIAFICAVDHADSQGRGCMTVVGMDDQPTHRSMGLATYLDAWFRDDAQADFSAMFPGGSE